LDFIDILLLYSSLEKVEWFESRCDIF
jgi:hypothetical protein